MKTILTVIVLLMLAFQAPMTAAQNRTARDIVQESNLQTDPPGHPFPAVAVPHHEPGHLSSAKNYTTEVEVTNALGFAETIQLAGSDALAAHNVDPLAGNYTMANKDQVVRSGRDGNVSSYDVSSTAISGRANSGYNFGGYYANDIASGDLNKDGIDEQIVAYLDEDSTLRLAVGELPGTVGKMTSAPAALAGGENSVHVFTRGYDDALWHCVYSVGGGCTSWDTAGGILLSAPAVVSTASGFDVYAILSDNQIYRRSWTGSWSGAWESVDVAGLWPAVDTIPMPTLDAPAVIARDNQVDLFRLAPDHTLYWRRYDGSAWADWKSLGGMLASAPTAAVLPDGSARVFAYGADQGLWMRAYTSGWSDWQEIIIGEVADGVRITSAPAAAAGSAGLDVYVRGSDGHLWSMHSADGSAWGAWVDGGGTLGSAIAPVVMPAGEIMLFAQTLAAKLQVKAGAADWAALSDGPPPCCTLTDTGLAGVRRNTGGFDTYQDYSLDVETGYIWGDGRKQIVVAYAPDGSNVNIALFDTSDTPTQNGFTPEKVAELVNLGPTSHTLDYFRIATGDFVDQNGIDDIAVAYVKGNTYAVDIVKLVHTTDPQTGVTTSALKVVSYGTAAKMIGYNDQHDPAVYQDVNRFGGTLQIAAGDFNYDAKDEIAVIMTGVYDDWAYFPACSIWHYVFTMRLYRIDGTSPTYTQKVNYIEEFRDEKVQPQGDWYLVGVNLSAGDVDADGKDELVRTWPNSFESAGYGCIWGSYPQANRFKRDIQVMKMDSGDWGTNAQISAVAKTTIDTTGAATDISYTDQLVVGDTDRNMKGEIIYQEAYPQDGQSKQFLHSYRCSYDGVAKSYSCPQIPTIELGWNYFPRLITGSFTGENLRVGPPSSRIQNRIDTLVTILGAPPTHRDLVKNADGSDGYTLVQSPTDLSSSSAKYASKTSKQSTQEVISKRGFTVGGTVDANGCLTVGSEDSNWGGCVTASVGYTYGYNFEKTTTDIQSSYFSQQVYASDDDKVVFYGTSYQVWEYPVFNNNTGEPRGYITVAFPTVQSTTSPSALSGYTESTCSEDWYTAEHQIYNLWSYDPIGDPLSFDDYKEAPAGQPSNLVYISTVDNGADGEIGYTAFQTTKSSDSFNHDLEASASVEAKAKGSVGVAKLEGSIKATFKGTYNNSSMNTDEIQTGEETAFSYYIGQQPEGLKYATRVIFYWAEDGYQVLNYQVTVGSTGGWSIYNKPDPAFLLPWYGFPNPDEPLAPPCGEAKKLWSPSVKVTLFDNPSAKITSAGVGERVSIWAKVRNFSNQPPTVPVVVRFYQGHPSLNVVIGEVTLDNVRRGTPQTARVDWTVSGSGKQQIYAVIDPDNAEDEVHDEDDLINNNTAYTPFEIGTGGYNDASENSGESYQGIAYTQGASQVGLANAKAAGQLSIAFNTAAASLDAVTRFEVKDVQGVRAGLVGNAFELVAYQGDLATRWDEPRPMFDLTKTAGSPPAVLSIDYSGMNLAAGRENELVLYEKLATGLRPASLSCGVGANNQPVYAPYLFPEVDRMVVPVCETGVFLLMLPPPTITTLNPLDITAGEAGFDLTVQGTGFVDGAVVRWNGADRVTTFVSATRLKAAITAADVAAAGSPTVTVFNPGAGGGESGGVTFTIMPAAGNPPLFLPMIASK